jgi:general secretion pathway protein H
VPVRWHVQAQGFRFDGLAPGQLPQDWLDPAAQALGTPVLVLGPEPLIAPQQVVLTLADLPGRQLSVATDGLRPFTAEALQ